jgi:type I restriction enzyme R subunit
MVGASKPEEQARLRIDEMLEAAGWVVQDHRAINVDAGLGVAVREFPVPGGEMDYVLFVDGKVIGLIEAEPKGAALLGVTQQANNYIDGFEQKVATKTAIPRYFDRPPFYYLSNGRETFFSNARDPHRRPRPVFWFHRPETIKAWAEEYQSLRTRQSERATPTRRDRDLQTLQL